MSIQSLKINLAEWLLLKVKYPSQFHFGTSADGAGLTAARKKIILTLLPSHDNLAITPSPTQAKRFLNGSIPILTLSRWI